MDAPAMTTGSSSQLPESAPNSGITSETLVWTRAAFGLIAGLAVVRVVYAAVVPLDLVTDEAYYWDWSRHLDWGYYSKPPMIAWIIAASTGLFGDTTFAVRLPAVLLGTGGLVFAFLLSRRMFDARTGFFATLLAAACPGNVVMSLLMTIDAPLMFFWGAAVYSLWRMLEGGPQRNYWAIAATLAIGLGVLSKQTMLGVIPLTGLFLISSKSEWKQLRHASTWLVPIVAMLFLLPVLEWNSRHDWITFQHTSEHFGSKTEVTPLSLRMARALEYFASQFGVLSPVTYGTFLTAGIGCLLAFRSLGRRERFLVAFSIVPLIGVFGLSWLQRVQPNWPAPFYATGVILVAACLCSKVGAEWKVWDRFGSQMLWRRAAIATGIAASLLTYATPFAVTATGIAGTGLDPTIRLRGWRETAAAIDQLWADDERVREVPVIFTENRTPASPVAFYLADQPLVDCDNPTGRIISQYDLWPDPAEIGRTGAYVITPAVSGPGQHLMDDALAWRELGEINVPLGAGESRHYKLFRLYGTEDGPTLPADATPLRKTFADSAGTDTAIR
ncbi:ArnT family glycosyltransferase [Stratiformator vulcanicus]|uniref:Undecaprenyl phosphate-alpha-4-amino-4-deoxy-L-arabinose arabinosyl transferase n=1 Tax=Stratiformator vulcanicus TaxID=2527980 RepID=A0A517QZS6_9PLAN|nr:glycosyltransferase family 39 protein [Stratiformator vulcanicus]QDT37152.1 Undecaprenyl phosphate-alpha-4-amino-4-deoxy-L-arabinose arabinosyl transferase [Stratiformator vulcanicus]